MPDVRTRLGSWNNYGYTQTDADPISAVGRFPVGYERLLRLAQWDPVLTRLTVMEPAALAELGPVPEVDWAAIADRDPGAGPVDGLPEGTALFAVTGDGVRKLGGATIDARRRDGGRRASDGTLFIEPSTEWSATHAADPVADPFPAIYEGGTGVMRQYGSITSWNGEVEQTSFLHRISVAPDEGLFRFVSRLSPQGGGTFEDLTLLAAGDDGRVLAAVAERPDGFVIYRYLTAGGEP